MTIKQHNYWHTTTHMPGEANTVTPIPQKADVAIIGGGYTGLSAAYTLAKQGVVLVTVNYRLGIFGFFAHPGLTSESSRHATGEGGHRTDAARVEDIARMQHRLARADVGALPRDVLAWVDRAEDAHRMVGLLLGVLDHHDRV